MEITNIKRISSRKSAAIAAGLVVAGIAFAAVHVVPAGHRGVVKVFGDVQDAPLSEGLHFLNPFARVIDFNVRFQSATAEKAEGGTADLQEVFEDITVNYEYDPAHAPYVYNNFGDDSDIEARFIVPALYESFKAVTSQYTAEQLVTQRAKVSQDIVQTLQGKLTKYRIIVSDINVQNFHFDEQFSAAVRQKVVAGQNRLTAEQNLETAKVTAQQKIVEAEGQAKAIAIQSQAIQQQGGTEYVALEAVKKWDGHLPQQWSGAAVPFINFPAQR
ncbi:prohibitin family protein [Paraburkholderia sp. Tr-20389]|uniref:prohibitin family protein n=1 Tax=Paraburkholderia sp. Tr-20389 TaxID=2703903 RepID=UPI00197E892C|nr:prohibitin family protein [Paraburkholderia sp. Tr-20389]MBN3751649.1 prohibitin family protein [Paraburkholderia sp. Tr-20389]